VIRAGRRLFFVFLAMLLPHGVYAGVYEEILTAVNGSDTAQVNELLQRGVDVDTADSAGNTLLLIAARNGNHQMLETLLKNKANVLKINKYGDSAPMLAAIDGHLEAVKMLAAAGADLDPVGWTPLIYAAFNGHVDILRFLLDQDVDIDAQSANGTTALMAASRNGHLAAVTLLLERKADPDLANQKGGTALDMSRTAGNSEITNLLVKAVELPLPGGKNTPDLH
jgi:ankyrin repeat protein